MTVERHLLDFFPLNIRIGVAEGQISELEIWVLISSQDLGLLDMGKRDVKYGGKLALLTLKIIEIPEESSKGIYGMKYSKK